MLIEALGLRKSYWMGPTEAPALRGVDLEVEQGEFLAIMGPSGSGKSTLLHLLGCLDRPSAGRYHLDGLAVERADDTELSRIRNRKIGFVFQAFNLIPQHDILENVELPLVYAEVARPVRRERSLDILRRVGLERKAHHRPTELSGGEVQRVAIARALVVEPLLLFGDEPTGNLDSHTGEGIMKLFVDLNRRGTTIVLVTHDPDVASYAQRTIHMRDGRIVSDSQRPLAVAAPGA
jgi:putative ABC transport system ATP-binding protein